ncbi:CO(2)-response secreted protease-like isoform X2 [Hibiscus syriacus]|uniref:CO(2)-response secreted protease-like isoform X2 n=1 Tax=Hibiscus syriacus TaxID=106335 RepID=UPI0019247FD3|nr:CO(2)-response secreted protease-like isoform X2 [Hibiscus syriacus]
MQALISFIFSFTSFLFLVSMFLEPGGAAADEDGVYIVYMGAPASSKGSLRDDHTQLLDSLLKRKKDALVHNYKKSFSGFAVLLSAEEANSIAESPGVVSVFPDPVLELHTTRSWDFLKYGTSVMMESNPSSDSNLTDHGSDVIIGIMDSGIWPESESFNDKEMGEIPKKWGGICAKGRDSSTFNCNRKIIGARSYGESLPRDVIGHGTHVASTAAGAEVHGASYYGLASGTARGGAPGSRLAIYDVFSSQNRGRGSTVLAAFDDAIADGVDVLSLSFGSSSILQQEFIKDPIAIGAFHAVQNNITVVCSAGNDGPNPGSVVNSAPWILTVAASTIDRGFESNVVLGNYEVIKGEGINFANIQASPVYPIMYAKSARKSGVAENATRNCRPDSMEQELIKGKIVVCDNEDSLFPYINKQNEVKKLGGIGVILIDDELREVEFNFGAFPTSVISSKDGAKVLSYINSIKNPVAVILPSSTNSKPAPTIPYFSSRGPSNIPKNILKPDIAAPGVNILAAWIGNDTAETPEGKEPPLYNLLSGTSMSSPHVSGIAATVKSRNPEWSPSAIRSAIMTTAAQINNNKAPIMTEKSTAATPYDFGAGEVSTTGPLQPGLVYETTTIDYLNFLCYHGYNTSTIKIMAYTIPHGFTCPKESSIDLISNINYPSISIPYFDEKAGRKVIRTLTNVAGDAKTVYNVSVDAPTGLYVQVVPDNLEFTKFGDKSSYQVSFSIGNPLKKDVFGSITWSNGKYKVRSPFAISSKNGGLAFE